TLYSELKMAGRGDRVRFDLGMVSGLNYYTGIVFRGYAEGAAKAIIAGGRYDNLTESFGFPLPSTGFAIYVDDLVACLPPAMLPRIKAVIHFASGMLDEAIRELETYSAGEAELSPYEEREKSLKLAKDRGAEYLICFGPDGKEEKHLEQA
ncbi:MAG: ATP phosphoribosyltransferase regulatory subunit, partial [Oscillospiraceae bacterium]|nr:ATP phosphoribosyltransferase regulatory subunit [Oscillospiraceae bacterium]